MNARELTLAKLSNLSGLKLNQDSIEIVVADLSFISLTLVLQQIVDVAPTAG